MRILWLKTELLHPVDKGGKIRTYQMLKELKKAHRVTYLTLDDGCGDPDALEKASEYAHEVVTVPHKTSAKFSAGFYLELAGNLASGLPYALQKYVSGEMQRKIVEMVDGGRFDILVCDFLAPAVNLRQKLRIPTLLFQHNVEALIWKRHFEIADNPAKKAYLKLQWRRMAGYEKRACRDFDWVVAVSREDAEIMRREYGVKNVSDVPTGVDTSFFVRNGSRPDGRPGIVFTGSMDWLPNEDAIRWFTNEILPLVRRQVPDVSLTVVGRNPSSSLVEVGERDPSVVVTGRVPDVRPYMEHAQVYIVPIRIGGGTRLKIYEAMAMELPVVSTTIGAEGLPVSDGDEIVLRDEPVAFADAVVKLLKDKVAAKELGSRAAVTVREKYSWEKVADDFAVFCEKAVEQRGRGGLSVDFENKEEVGAVHGG